VEFQDSALINSNVSSISHSEIHDSYEIHDSSSIKQLLQASPHMQQTLSQLIDVMNVPVTSYLRHM